MKLGIVGLPNVGKSTLFNSLTKAGALSANYPFATIDPNVGIVSVPDERIVKLGELYHTKKVTPATIEFVDIAGLVKGASKGEGLGNQSETTSLSPDFQIHIHVCPWHTQFKNMGLPEAGLLYCKDLDASISRGFNPEIRYEVSQTLHDHDYCIQTIRNAGLTPESNMAKNPAGLRSFEYHCAHSYWAYREVCEAIFGEEGTRIAERVLDDFAAEYGKKMADTLAGYARTNFNIAD